MNTIEFKMYHNSTTEQVKVKMEQEDEVFFVSIDDDFLGSMEMITNSDVDFETDDEKLQEYIEGISMYLRNEKSKQHLPDLLLARYGENIVRCEFINDEVLEIITHPDTDIEEFGNAVRDLIYDDVTFESKLSVVISKENDEYTFDFDIN